MEYNVGMDVQNVLSLYPTPFPTAVAVAWNTNGFSGAEIWRVQLDGAGQGGTYCLRAWPPGGVSQEQLSFIHGVLRRMVLKGENRVPPPIEAQSGETFVYWQQRFWELVPWMPGRADFHNDPRPEKLLAALTALAEIHVAAGDYPCPGVGQGGSPGLADRCLRLQALLAGDADRLAGAVHPGRWPDAARIAWRLIDGFRRAAPRLAPLLESAARVGVPLQAVLADIQHDHVLFTGQQVTGIVDFGSMRVDSVAADIARLLGSMVGDDRACWQAGLDAYQRVRPLTPQEALLTEAFDRSTVLMAGMNWIDWVFRQGRQFGDPQAVLTRMQEIARRLDRLQ